MTTTEAVAESSETLPITSNDGQEGEPQVELPGSSAMTRDALALVRGEPFTKLPDDLYIPPDALEIFLEAFEGPLDLLLYLIKRNNMEILDIQVAEITRQYMEYVQLMQSSQFELAAEYLVMAATLAEIKSRMLLPRVSEGEEEEEDPRAELVRRLQEYERFKQAAEDIDALPRMGRNIWPVNVQAPDYERTQAHPEVDLQEILLAMGEIIRRADRFENHLVEEEALSVRERMSEVLSMLSPERFTPFVALYRVDEGRLGVVVTFMAIMELIKESLIELVQSEPFGPIHVKARIE
ncbi:MAG: segregation and condensation protein A [Endozoicomonas sp.]